MTSVFGGAGQPQLWGVPIVAPQKAANWTWNNQGSATLQDGNNSLFATIPTGTTDNWRSFTRPVPSTPYDVSIFMLVYQHGVHNSAMSLLTSDGTKMSMAEIYTAAGQLQTAASNWTNNTTPSADQSGETVYPVANNVQGQVELFLRITDDGVNRNTYYSYDGKFWLLMGTDIHAGFLTPTQIGFGFNNWDNTNPIYASILSASGIN